MEHPLIPSAPAPESSREILARTALATVGRLLSLIDRNPHSPTYGCVDRLHWHYRMIDFPSGMQQEAALPLALAWKLPIPGNPWHQNPALPGLIRAAVDFAVRSSHRDGSCDDYFPFEKAGGATAFSLFGMIEACHIVGLREPGHLAFFERRADWLCLLYTSPSPRD